MEELNYVHIPETSKPAKYTFDRTLKILANQLEGNNFLLGDNFSAIDIHFLIDLEWAEALNWIEGNAQEELLKDYYDRVRQRAAYKKCWKMRSKLDLSSKALNTFTPANQKPLICMEQK
jgi:glutathione S-transferase